MNFSFIQNNNKNQKIIIGLSGGKDSSALLHMSLQKFNKKNIIPVIINHNLRKESTKESIAIKKYWKKEFNMKVYIINWYHPVSKQKKAREFRLLNLAIFAIKYNQNQIKNTKNKIPIVLLGHNFEDKLETYIIREKSYSTTWGLASISYKTTIYGVEFIRPLLFTSIDYINNYIKNNNIKIFEDETNKTNKYTRNIIRHQELPIINKDFIIKNIIKYIEERVHYMHLINIWVKFHLNIINRFLYKFIWNRLPSNKKLASLILMYMGEKIQGKRIDSHERFYPYLNFEMNLNKRNFHVNECKFTYRGDYVYVEEILPLIIVLKKEGLWHNKFLVIDTLNNKFLGEKREFIFYNKFSTLKENNNLKGIFIFNNHEINLNYVDTIIIDHFLIKYTDYNFYNEYLDFKEKI
jgi:tRNA(Ile)-lysidine synthetase-like protein